MNITYVYCVVNNVNPHFNMRTQSNPFIQDWNIQPRVLRLPISNNCCVIIYLTVLLDFRYRRRTKEIYIEKDIYKSIDLPVTGIYPNNHRYQTGGSLSESSFYTDRDCQWKRRHCNRRRGTCDIGPILLCLWRFEASDIGSCSGSGIPFCVLERVGIRQREFHNHRNEL